MFSSGEQTRSLSNSRRCATAGHQDVTGLRRNAVEQPVHRDPGCKRGYPYSTSDSIEESRSKKSRLGEDVANVPTPLRRFPFRLQENSLSASSSPDAALDAPSPDAPTEFAALPNLVLPRLSQEQEQQQTRARIWWLTGTTTRAAAPQPQLQPSPEAAPQLQQEMGGAGPTGAASLARGAATTAVTAASQPQIQPSPEARPQQKQEMQEFRPGDKVQIYGLQNAVHLNGKTAILEEFIDSSHRWRAQLEDGEKKLLKLQNIMKDQDSPQEMKGASPTGAASPTRGAATITVTAASQPQPQPSPEARPQFQHQMGGAGPTPARRASSLGGPMQPQRHGRSIQTESPEAFSEYEERLSPTSARRASSLGVPRPPPRYSRSIQTESAEAFSAYEGRLSPIGSFADHSGSEHRESFGRSAPLNFQYVHRINQDIPEWIDRAGATPIITSSAVSNIYDNNPQIPAAINTLQIAIEQQTQHIQQQTQQIHQQISHHHHIWHRQQIQQQLPHHDDPWFRYPPFQCFPWARPGLPGQFNQANQGFWQPSAISSSSTTNAAQPSLWNRPSAVELEVRLHADRSVPVQPSPAPVHVQVHPRQAQVRVQGTGSSEHQGAGEYPRTPSSGSWTPAASSSQSVGERASRTSSPRLRARSRPRSRARSSHVSPRTASPVARAGASSVSTTTSNSASWTDSLAQRRTFPPGSTRSPYLFRPRSQQPTVRMSMGTGAERSRASRSRSTRRTRRRSRSPRRLRSDESLERHRENFEQRAQALLQRTARLREATERLREATERDRAPERAAGPSSASTPDYDEHLEERAIRERLERLFEERAAIRVIMHLLENEQPQTQAASLVSVANLPTHTVTSEELENCAAENRACTICFDDFCAGDEQKFLPCFHRFHRQCVDRWFEQSALCPICKHSVEASNANDVVDSNATSASSGSAIAVLDSDAEAGPE